MKRKPLRKDTSKLFVVRKYIKANSAAEAIQKDKKHPVDDVWIDEKWKEGQGIQLAEAIGFHVERAEDE